MGTVFRAHDRETDRTVAVKVVEPAFANARFEREAELLARLEDPAIVRYVAHGPLDGGRMYLAMEWLEGEPLDKRLTAGPLPIADCLAIATRLARALGSAHAMGIIHRDVKPANVILREGAASDATLVDFGIARFGGAAQNVTATGVVIGTPAYMAPEQARALPVDARADVFSLGCVLFECLSGRAAFVGEHVVAVLAKILLEAAPRVRTLRADVPPELDALVARMLEKDPAARLPGGAEIVSALEAIESGAAVPSLGKPASAIGVIETRLATIVLARMQRSATDESYEVLASSETALAGLTAEGAVADAATRFGVPMTMLANGAIVGIATAREGATDAAERAARCALALAASAKGATIVLATGRAIVGVELPVGTAIDEAARLLWAHEGRPGIFIDAATAAMVESRFELARADERREIAIRRERAVPRERSVLGRAAPCVGRDREIALLESTFAESRDEPIAQALLVLAPPGLGKTRLRRELVARLGASGSPDRAAPEIWLGLADPMMQGAPFALAGDVLRRALGIVEDEPVHARRAKVLARVPDRRAAAFIGELAGARFDDMDEPALRAARNNPGLLEAQAMGAIQTFASSVLAKRPLVVVLEDIHWADRASLRAFTSLVSQEESRPLLLLGLARASVDEVHPNLWADVRSQRVVLQPLSKKAATHLVRALLGADVEVDAIVERAGGNALFVEELARAQLEGHSPAELPPTIAAAAEARILALDPQARVVLRAAAVFGERFWRGAVARLIGASAATPLEDHLATLERLEMVTRSPDSRFAEEPELVFRHALVRDAAYAMLTDHDRQLAHSLAGEWLAERIEDAVLLAHHFEEGDRPEDAARWHARAADDALAAGDFDETLRHADRAIALTASDPIVGRAQLSRAQVFFWRGTNEEARAIAALAMTTLERASTPWFAALGIAAAAAGKLEDTADLATWTNLIEQTPALDEASERMRTIARARAAMQLFYLGAPDRADALLAGCEGQAGAAADPTVLTWLFDARFERAFALGYAVHPSTLDEGIELCRQIGDRRGEMIHIGNKCVALGCLGAYAEGIAIVERARTEMKEARFFFFDMITSLWKGVMEGSRGDFTAFDTASAAIMKRSVRAGSANRISLSYYQLSAGRVEDAQRTLDEIAAVSRHTPPFYTLFLAQSARLALRRGELERALELSEESRRLAASGVGFPLRFLFDISRVEVLEAAGRNDEARAALEQGVVQLRRVADVAAEHRESFLARRPDSAELVAMAKTRGIVVV
jgi:eukaryotic-like serine/threonine-protein kinase